MGHGYHFHASFAILAYATTIQKQCLPLSMPSITIASYQVMSIKLKYGLRVFSNEDLLERGSLGLLKLRLSMAGTLAIIIGVSTLFFTVILSLIGTFSLLNMAFFVVAFNILQWLIGPYLINAMYRVKALSELMTFHSLLSIETRSQR